MIDITVIIVRIIATFIVKSGQLSFVRIPLVRLLWCIAIKRPVQLTLINWHYSV